MSSAHSPSGRAVEDSSLCSSRGAGSCPSKPQLCSQLAGSCLPLALYQLGSIYLSRCLLTLAQDIKNAKGLSKCSVLLARRGSY